MSGPFDLKSDAIYTQWRARKLESAAMRAVDMTVSIASLTAATAVEIAKILTHCHYANMAIYACRNQTEDPTELRQFGAMLGLHRVDHHLCVSEHGVAALTSAQSGPERLYAPYSNRSLSWHTDGYYNAPDEQVRAVILHCMTPARSGGENALLDPERAYIHLRDQNPDYITALMHPDCLTIPANEISEDEIRPARTGPVFSINPKSGRLHMRFTARKRHVIWRDNAMTRAAVACLLDLLNDPGGPVLRHRLAAGEGVISNNILHNRTGFDDAHDAPRLLYRARFHDEIRNETAKPKSMNTKSPKTKSP
jgi:alpha-ketoglutarate-dependent taurine dioxygenase